MIKMINYGEIVKDCLIAIGVGAIGLFVLNVYIKYPERKEAQPKSKEKIKMGLKVTDGTPTAISKYIREQEDKDILEDEISFLTELKNHYNNTSETYNKIKERIEELKLRRR